MDRKQAIYWLLFSALGFVVLILTGDQPVITDSKDSFNFGIFELAALGLLIGIWIFLTGSNPERTKLKKEMPDIISIQTGLLAKYNESMFDAAKSTAAIFNNARSEYQGWFEKGIEDIKSSTEIDNFYPFPADKIKKTARKTRQYRQVR